MSDAMQTPQPPQSRPAPRDVPLAAPWWRFPIVWLVVGGPALVVVASFVTLWLAITHPDPVLHEPSAEAADLRSIDERSHPTAGTPAHLLPALQARNHAATGGQ